MEVISHKLIPDVKIVIPDVYGDERGWFVVLEDNTLFSYKCDALYNKTSERGLMFDDPALGIEWPKIDMPIILSEKDRHHPTLLEVEALDFIG